MVVVPSGQRFGSHLSNVILTRFDMRFEFSFLSIYRRNSHKALIETWDVADRCRWTLSGDELATELATGFIYPDWMFPNWELVDSSVRSERDDKHVLDAALRCRIDPGQPVPGGVWGADKLVLRFDLDSGLMILAELQS